MARKSGRLRLWTAWILAALFFWFARPGTVSIVTGATVVLLGLGIRGWAAGILEKDRELAVSGPYSFTRNPLYLGSFAIGIGAVVAGGQPWFGLIFVAFFATLYRGAMVRESERLAERFGSTYRHYRDTVPMFFPRGTRYDPFPEARPAPGKACFSLTRYRRNREYEALLGAAAAFGLLSMKAVGWLRFGG